MKEQNSFEIINTKDILSKNQQSFYRNQLKRLVKNEGIISICLDYGEAFIEYKPDILNKDSLKDLLLDIKFPMNEKLIESPKIF